MTVQEFSLLQSLYRTILERELGHPVPVPSGAQELTEEGGTEGRERPVPEALQQWLAMMDLAVTPHLLRSYVMETDADEPTLEALIRFLVGKPTHSEADRDKVDWLLTFYFRRREERTKRSGGWFKTEIQELLAGFEFPPLSRFSEDLLQEIPSLLDEVSYLQRFSQITDTRMIERGRDLKNQFGGEFFHPEILTPLVNYNLSFGKKFQDLFRLTMQQVHEFVHAQPGSGVPDPVQLLQSDYRSTGETFRHLSDLGRKEQPQVAPPSSSAAPSALPGAITEDQLKRLGIDTGREAANLKNRAQDLSARLRGNPALNSIPNPFSPLPLSEWEAGAFRSQIPESEQTFRAEFARAVTRAIVIVVRIYEEIPQYVEKKSTEFLWKKHYDALISLLYEGRKHKETLLQLAASSQQKGLHEKAKQLQGTSGKLEGGLAKIAELF